MTESSSTLYAGIANITYEGEPFDLGHGVILRSTYAHFFTSNMVAFARPSAAQHHPAPWRAAHGGRGNDIEVELAIPTRSKLPGGLDAANAVRLIAALLRLAKHTYLMVPVVSNIAFSAAASSENEPTIRQFEFQPRIFHAASSSISRLEQDTLLWIKSVWGRTAEISKSDPSLAMAIRAADACTLEGRTAAALLTAWGALEELFAPSRAELRFRVSANIAAYLEPVGEKRLELFRTVANLYNARSKAAHTAQDADIGFLLQSFVILRNALIRIIDEGRIPSPTHLEALLFCGDSASKTESSHG